MALRSNIARAYEDSTTAEIAKTISNAPRLPNITLRKRSDDIVIVSARALPGDIAKMVKYLEKRGFNPSIEKIG